MGHATIHVSSPDYWMVYLASSIGGYLNDKQTRNQLDRDYKEFLEHDDEHGLLVPEAREMLPQPPSKERTR